MDQSARFKEAAKHGNLIPLYRPIFSDHLTPVLAYRCLVREDDREAPSFLFESVEPGLKVSSVVSFFLPTQLSTLKHPLAMYNNPATFKNKLKKKKRDRH